MRKNLVGLLANLTKQHSNNFKYTFLMHDDVFLTNNLMTSL